ncbi:type II toxin-antitoxin system HicB family antitoxin [Dysgonomonas sp. 511]|uniref:type II toxin-antitoxin system HicB family antitoxin n=1 Tax=Dysgonomonas sp. 511 TaxID=2302930 RepID=UPI0013D181AF|nr:DNA-binding protein [Dysgonomonas sp. 511]NDV79830.1 DNA-binding protein [Dysgonomonas sp. 511]
MKVDVIIERGKDGFYSAYMDYEGFDFGLNGQGDTVDEAIAVFMDAHKDMGELYNDEGKKYPDLEFNYRYDISSFLDYYSGILSKSGLEKVTGVNQKQLWHYAKGVRKPQKETVLKIQEKLHKFGEELSRINFID